LFAIDQGARKPEVPESGFELPGNLRVFLQELLGAPRFPAGEHVNILPQEPSNLEVMGLFIWSVRRRCVGFTGHG
jgi:hypothetical protein